MPGEEAQCDWADFGRIRVGNTERRIYALVIVLSWSCAIHVHFSHDQAFAAVARGHNLAFEAFGGAPRSMLYDNMKTVVLERDGQSFLAGLEFDTLSDLEMHFVRWRDELPAHPFDDSETRSVIAHKQPYVRLDTNLYSIPWDLVSKPLTLVSTHQQVRVLDGQRTVACHRHSCSCRTRSITSADSRVSSTWSNFRTGTRRSKRGMPSWRSTGTSTCRSGPIVRARRLRSPPNHWLRDGAACVVPH